MYYLDQKYSNAAFSLDSNRLTERRDEKEVANPTRASLLRALSYSRLKAGIEKEKYER